LRAERGLCATTVQTYVAVLRQFVTEHAGEAAASVATVSARDVATFVRRHARAASPGRAQLMTTALRAMFRFFFHAGEVPVDLSVAVPTVPDWRLARVPRSLAPEDVERLLIACDQQTATGRRDYAILLLLARLGLRAGEVVALELDDLHWRTAEITIRGKKGLRHDRFPLPRDVGAALVAYLRERAPIVTRRVFLCMRAPRRSFRGPGAVTTIVRRALARADLHPPMRGAHLLRHSLATRMLRHGASFVEIGAVLRHRAAGTTEIYAKLDLESLRAVVQPWPDAGGAQ
jgi:site-specific recombinase XerD